MKPKKKGTYVQGPKISVMRLRLCFYENRRLSFNYLNQLGVSGADISVVKTRMKLIESPKGLYGGDVGDEDSVTEFIKSLGLEVEKIKYKNRFFVTDNGVPTMDETPKHGLVYDYSKNKGFKNRLVAQMEAVKRYEWFCKICRDDSGKESQPVTLVLYDKDGNLVKKLTNEYKKKIK